MLSGLKNINQIPNADYKGFFFNSKETISGKYAGWVIIPTFLILINNFDKGMWWPLALAHQQRNMEPPILTLLLLS